MSKLRNRKTDDAVVTAEDKDHSAAPKAGDDEGKMEKMKKRLIYGWAMIFSFLFIMYMGHLYVIGLVVVLQIALFRELTNVRYKASQANKIPKFRTLQWCWFIVAMFYTYGSSFFDFVLSQRNIPDFAFYGVFHSWFSFSLYVILFMVSILSFKKGMMTYQMSQLTWTVVTIGVIVFQMRYVCANIFAGLFWFLLPCSLVICNDCMAYFCGMSMGGKITSRSFLPTLSPKKTWEGFVGGAICTCIFAFYWAQLLSQWEWLRCPLTELGATELTCKPIWVFQAKTYVFNMTSFGGSGAYEFTCLPIQLHSFALAGFASIVAPFGGFFASAIKRAYGVKDFDTFIPGHGGAMDRMDCQMIMALCTSVHYHTFIAPKIVTIGSIMAAVSQLTPEDKEQVHARLGEMLGVGQE